MIAAVACPACYYVLRVRVGPTAGQSFVDLLGHANHISCNYLLRVGVTLTIAGMPLFLFVACYVTEVTLHAQRGSKQLHDVEIRVSGQSLEVYYRSIGRTLVLALLALLSNQTKRKQERQ